jgi:hypothetical protein
MFSALFVFSFFSFPDDISLQPDLDGFHYSCCPELDFLGMTMQMEHKLIPSTAGNDKQGFFCGYSRASLLWPAQPNGCPKLIYFLLILLTAYPRP